MAEGTTAMGRTRMRDMMLRGYSVDGDVRTANGSGKGSFGATGRVRRKTLCVTNLGTTWPRAGPPRRPFSVTLVWVAEDSCEARLDAGR